MKNNEEKLREFLNDENKAKKFVNDGEFIGKISGGVVTPQNYIDEFKKFDINLTEDEANEMARSTNKFLSMSDRRIDDEVMSGVVGGLSPAGVGGVVAAGITSGAGIMAMIPMAAGAISCASKARQAQKEGKTEEAERLMNNYREFIRAEWIISGATVAGSAAMGLGTYGLCKLLDKII